MANQKIENLLNLALETPLAERLKSQNLNTGYDEETDSWDIIVKSQEDLTRLEQVDERIKVVQLLGQYAILTVPQELVDTIASLQEIEYLEKPKRMYFALDNSTKVSCVDDIQETGPLLTGKGVIIAILDSGIDYMHPDFINEDGTTRILRIWDQTIPGNPPQGYRIGTEYTSEEINRALQENDQAQRLQIVGSQDVSTHGTHVAGIAAGNGRASNGRYKGVAPDAELIVVKLGNPRQTSFPRTTELMQAVDYSIRQAIAFNKPIAINISFGNSYGSHDGNSLLETYLDTVYNIWKSVIVVGNGNEGFAAGHTSGKIEQGQKERVSVAISPYETTVNIQIWKNYGDIFGFRVIAPSGDSVELYPRSGRQQFVIGETQLLLYYGEPNPYSVAQEIYIDFIPNDQYIESGVWQIEIEGRKVVYGAYDMWLPSASALNTATEFLNPTVVNTLTIPSTSQKVISVGAYDSNTNAYASFSGRGEQTQTEFQKPDLAAPGVNITSTAPGGGYSIKSGTSMATPFVSGASALLMEWGIVRERDTFLYGDD